MSGCGGQLVAAGAQIHRRRLGRVILSSSGDLACDPRGKLENWWSLGSDSGRMSAVAKRPRFSRWRRLPGVFRTGENRPTDSGTELDRIILYVPARILDLAESARRESRRCDGPRLLRFAA